MSTCTAKTAQKMCSLRLWSEFLDLAATFKFCECDKQSSTRCKTVVSLKRFLVNVIHQAICSCSDSEQPVESPNYSSGLERVLFTENNIKIFFRTIIFIYLVKKKMFGGGKGSKKLFLDFDEICIFGA